MKYLKQLIIISLFLLIFSLTVSAQIDFEGNPYVKTNSRESYTINYTISQDLDYDGQVRLTLGHIWENISILHIRGGHWKNLQITNPLGNNYAKVDMNRSSFVVSQSDKPLLFGRTVLVNSTNPSDPLKAGEVIEFIIGYKGQGGSGWQVATTLAEITFVIEERKNSNSSWERVYADQDYPTIETGGVTLKRFKVIADSSVKNRKNVNIKIQALQNKDSFTSSSHLIKNYTGTIEFSSDDPNAYLPQPYTYTLQDQGVKDFVIRYSSPGVHTLTVNEVGNTSRNGTSNPTLVKKRSEWYSNYNIYWGNMHSHTGIGGHALHTPDYAYTYAKYVEGLDFYGLTEHCNSVNANLYFDWNILKNYGVKYNDPSKFLAFTGYEWTSTGEGHRNVILKNAETWSLVPCPFDSTGTYKITKIDNLLENITGTESIFIPHHSAKDMATMNWSSYKDHPNQPLVEMYSWHGSSEVSGTEISPYGLGAQQYGNGFYVREALADGYKFGFTSDGDNHFGQAGSNSKANGVWYFGKMGITGVYAKNFNRNQIWKALEERRTFGTTGGRLLGFFAINKHFVGSEFTTNKLPHLKAVLISNNPFVSVEVYRNGEEQVYYAQPNVTKFEFDWIDTNVTSGEEYSYYVKGIDENGDRIWISPIWVNYTTNNLNNSVNPNQPTFGVEQSLEL